MSRRAWRGLSVELPVVEDVQGVQVIEERRGSCLDYLDNLDTLDYLEFHDRV